MCEAARSVSGAIGGDARDIFRSHDDPAVDAPDDGVACLRIAASAARAALKGAEQPRKLPTSTEERSSEPPCAAANAGSGTGRAIDVIGPELPFACDDDRRDAA